MTVVLLPVRQPDPPGWRETVASLLDNSDFLTWAEISFLMSIIPLRRLSPRLQEIVARISTSVAERIAAWDRRRA
jgi:hypothetical protein